MIHSEVERAVARATGESRRFVRSYGFSLLSEDLDHSTQPALAIDCPGCGAVIYREDPISRCREVECPRCDAVYPVEDDEHYVAEELLVTPAA